MSVNTDLHGMESDADGNKVVGVTPRVGRSFKFGAMTGGEAHIQSVTPVGHTQLTAAQFEARYGVPAAGVAKMAYSTEGTSLDQFIADSAPENRVSAPGIKFDPSGNKM